MQNKREKKIFLSEIIAFEMAAVNGLYLEGNTYHGKSMRQETVLRHCLSVRKIFSDAIAFPMINNC